MFLYDIFLNYYGIIAHILQLNSYHVLHDTTEQAFQAVPFHVCCPIPFSIVHDPVLATHILFSRCCSLVHVGTMIVHTAHDSVYPALHESIVQAHHRVPLRVC